MVDININGGNLEKVNSLDQKKYTLENKENLKSLEKNIFDYLDKDEKYSGLSIEKSDKSYDEEVIKNEDGTSSVILKDENGRPVKRYEYSGDVDNLQKGDTKTSVTYVYNDDGSYTETKTEAVCMGEENPNIRAEGEKENNEGDGYVWAEQAVSFFPVFYDSEGNKIDAPNIIKREKASPEYEEAQRKYREQSPHVKIL